jgi:hypothetical protein
MKLGVEMFFLWDIFDIAYLIRAKGYVNFFLL